MRTFISRSRTLSLVFWINYVIDTSQCRKPSSIIYVGLHVLLLPTIVLIKCGCTSVYLALGPFLVLPMQQILILHVFASLSVTRSSKLSPHNQIPCTCFLSLFHLLYSYAFHLFVTSSFISLWLSTSYIFPFLSPSPSCHFTPHPCPSYSLPVISSSVYVVIFLPSLLSQRRKRVENSL